MNVIVSILGPEGDPPLPGHWTDVKHCYDTVKIGISVISVLIEALILSIPMDKQRSCGRRHFHPSVWALPY